jgi:hypothetical protein
LFTNVNSSSAKTRSRIPYSLNERRKERKSGMSGWMNESINEFMNDSQ